MDKRQPISVEYGEEVPTLAEGPDDLSEDDGASSSCGGKYHSMRCACLSDSWQVYRCELNPNLKSEYIFRTAHQIYLSISFAHYIRFCWSSI